MDEYWERVAEAVTLAHAITWDTCHKIYIAMDEGEVEQLREYGYDPIITSAESSPEQMLATLKEWYQESCGLRFIDAVRYDREDPNAGFRTLIPQCGEDKADA